MEEEKTQNPTIAIEKAEDPPPVSVPIPADIPKIRPPKRTAHATAIPKTGEGGGVG